MLVLSRSKTLCTRRPVEGRRNRSRVNLGLELYRPWAPAEDAQYSRAAWSETWANPRENPRGPGSSARSSGTSPCLAQKFAPSAAVGVGGSRRFGSGLRGEAGPPGQREVGALSREAHAWGAPGGRHPRRAGCPRSRARRRPARRDPRKYATPFARFIRGASGWNSAAQRSAAQRSAAQRSA